MSLWPAANRGSIWLARDPPRSLHFRDVIAVRNPPAYSDDPPPYSAPPPRYEPGEPPAYRDEGPAARQRRADPYDDGERGPRVYAGGRAPADDDDVSDEAKEAQLSYALHSIALDKMSGHPAYVYAAEEGAEPVDVPVPTNKQIHLVFDAFYAWLEYLQRKHRIPYVRFNPPILPIHGVGRESYASRASHASLEDNPAFQTAMIVAGIVDAVHDSDMLDMANVLRSLGGSEELAEGVVAYGTWLHNQFLIDPQQTRQYRMRKYEDNVILKACIDARRELNYHHEEDTDAYDDLLARIQDYETGRDAETTKHILRTRVLYMIYYRYVFTIYVYNVDLREPDARPGALDASKVPVRVRADYLVAIEAARLGMECLLVRESSFLPRVFYREPFHVSPPEPHLLRRLPFNTLPTMQQIMRK